MEIAVLQQLISQESRAGTSGGGGGVEGRFITEGRFANGSYTTHEVMGPPVLYATGYRACWPSSGSYTSQYNDRTYISSQGYADANVSWLYQGGNWGGGNNSGTNFDGLGSGLICEHTDEYGCNVSKPFNVPNNSTSYGPKLVGVFFVRNTSNSAATFSWSVAQASYWSSGYDGMGVSAYVFNNSALSAVSSTNFQNLWNYTGSTSGNNSSVSISVPAGCTAAILFAQTMYYWTSFSSGGHWFYHFGHSWGSMFSNANATFKPDLRTTAAFWMLRDMDALDTGDNYYANNGSNIFVKSANMAAEYFGDYT